MMEMRGVAVVVVIGRVLHGAAVSAVFAAADDPEMVAIDPTS